MTEEIEYYLNQFKKLIPQLPLTQPVYKEGTTAGQILFHALQATNSIIRVRILRDTFPRDREAEFKVQPTIDSINTSLDQAYECLDMLKSSKPDLSDELAEPMKIIGSEFILTTNLQALLHASAHLAEHFGELNQVGRSTTSV